MRLILGSESWLSVVLSLVAQHDHWMKTLWSGCLLPLGLVFFEELINERIFVPV